MEVDVSGIEVENPISEEIKYKKELSYNYELSLHVKNSRLLLELSN